MHDSRDEVLLFLAPVRKIMVIFTILVRKKYNWICSAGICHVLCWKTNKQCVTFEFTAYTHVYVSLILIG